MSNDAPHEPKSVSPDEVKVSIYLEGLGMKICGMYPISKARQIVDFAVDSLIELNQKEPK